MARPNDRAEAGTAMDVEQGTKRQSGPRLQHDGYATESSLASLRLGSVVNLPVNNTLLLG